MAHETVGGRDRFIHCRENSSYNILLERRGQLERVPGFRFRSGTRACLQGTRCLALWQLFGSLLFRSAAKNGVVFDG